MADAAAESYVSTLGMEVIALANGGRRGDKALQKRFAALMTRYINIPNVAAFALGLHQKDLPATDKAMFYDLVANYAAALFVWYVDDFKGQALKVGGSDQQGKFITVDTSIDNGGLGGEKMRWRVVKQGDGFRVSDLNIKGVWLTIAMKKLFSDTLRASNGNFQALYAKLREAESW
ncbi:MAG: ABC transporter substrate-binding protein [Alphaproteobacteria bacterium]|nr:ABC transporter substrate-binding protein [Alphaproteobacteria bacterium]